MQGGWTTTGFLAWHKVIIVACLVLAILGTGVMVGGTIGMSRVISDYGGKVGLPLVVISIIGFLATWLFAAFGIILAHIAKTNRHILLRLKDMEAQDTGGDERVSSP